VSEPESLATAEGLAEHVRRHSYDRLIMLSDGIFAFATTLAAVSVRIPAHAPSLEVLLRGSMRSLAAYALSFAIACMFWISSRNLLARMRKVDAPFTILTLAMLCIIALIPATIRSLYLEHAGEAGFHLYALAMFLCGVINLAMWAYAALTPDLMLDAVSGRERWSRVVFAGAFPVLFVPALLLPSDRFVAATIPVVVVVFILRRVIIPRWLRGGAGHAMRIS
jgi:TMEM175 potassium channel family protein